ncbi:MAG: PepSY domain-containing protein [Bauldia sp.]|nr:PepSY domain-containing protein [Bauldia sp.]
MRKSLIAPFVALAFAATAGVAFAADEGDDMAKAAGSGNWMTKEEITKVLTDQGYEVRQVKTEDNGYEVYAIDKNGNRVESEVDPQTGMLIGTDSDD